MTIIRTLLDLPSSLDPDDARRRKLLNIVLIGFTILALLSLVIVIISSAAGALGGLGDPAALIATNVALLLGFILIFLVNRYWSGLVASSVFLIFLTILLAFSDTPQEVVSGRTTFFFVIPVIMASVLLRSYGSFIMAGLSTIAIVLVGFTSQVAVDPTPLIGFFAIGLISWLSSRSLEQTLAELRATNAELDQRVADRTRELSEALTREHTEAGRRQAILQGIGDGVIVLGTDNKIIMANPAVGRLLSTPVEQLMSHPMSDVIQSPLLAEEDRSTLTQIISAADATMAPVRIRWDKKTLSVNAAPVQDQNGLAIGNVAVLRDFTREAEVEEMKNAFVAMVSHELRTPLNAILGYSEMLRDAVYGAVNDKQSNAADRILKNSRRLLDIVSDLLDKAQIEAGHMALNYSEFKTTELIENLHSVMDKIAHDKGLELSCSVAPDMPGSLRNDSQRLQQVMVNLVNNAVKFTDKGGINVQFYRVTEEHWAFDVTDTGPGIAAEDQKYIFDPFRQVDATATRSHGGIGLGLSIVKRIVDLMGGRIFVQSALGHGTTFTVILPFEPIAKKEH